MKFQTKYLSIAVPIGIIVLILGYFFAGYPIESKATHYGVTWSAPYARSLGLDPQKGLEAVLDDLGVRQFRLPAYWTEIEQKPGDFDFSEIDRELAAIQKRGGTAMVAIGARLPRWPECWVPDWAKNLSQIDRDTAQLAYEKATIEHLSNNPAVIGWQIENEPTLTSFMTCPGLTGDLVLAELHLARRMELQAHPTNRKPIILTFSGELSGWTDFAGQADEIGISVYREVRGKYIGPWSYWFLPPWFYGRKAALVESRVGPVHVSEFQMEPWSDRSLPDTPIDEQVKLFSPDRMQDHFWYAEHLGFSRVDFWGVEWWYWMKEKQGNSQYWDLAKKFWTMHTL